MLKVKFQTLHQTVVTNVNPAGIMDFLFSKGVIGVDDMEPLQRVKDREGVREQCRKLLTLLHTSDHPQAFIQLYAAIKEESHLQWLAERIDKFSYQSGDLLHIIATFDQGRSQEFDLGYTF